MSILPISTNFTGMRHPLVPKCQIIDVDVPLNVNTDNPTVVDTATILTIAGGSIVTNITILAGPNVNNAHVFLYVYAVPFIMTTLNWPPAIADLTYNLYGGLYPNPGETNLQINNIGPLLGAPLTANSQVVCYNLVDTTQPVPLINGPIKVTLLIEFLAEESPSQN